MLYVSATLMVVSVLTGVIAAIAGLSGVIQALPAGLVVGASLMLGYAAACAMDASEVRRGERDGN
jgi:uncharacterized membrane-anchored protein